MFVGQFYVPIDCTDDSFAGILAEWMSPEQSFFNLDPRTIEFQSSALAQIWEIRWLVPPTTSDHTNDHRYLVLNSLLASSIRVGSYETPNCSFQLKLSVPSYQIDVYESNPVSLLLSIASTDTSTLQIKIFSTEVNRTVVQTELTVEIQDLVSYLKYLVLEPVRLQAIIQQDANQNVSVDVTSPQVTANLSKSSLLVLLGARNRVQIINHTRLAISYGQMDTSESKILKPDQQDVYSWLSMMKTTELKIGYENQFAQIGVRVDRIAIQAIEIEHFGIIWADVKIRGGDTIVSLRSSYVIHNNTSLQMEVTIGEETYTVDPCDIPIVDNDHESPTYWDTDNRHETHRLGVFNSKIKLRPIAPAGKETEWREIDGSKIAEKQLLQFHTVYVWGIVTKVCEKASWYSVELYSIAYVQNKLPYPIPLSSGETIQPLDILCVYTDPTESLYVCKPQSHRQFEILRHVYETECFETIRVSREKNFVIEIASPYTIHNMYPHPLQVDTGASLLPTESKGIIAAPFRLGSDSKWSSDQFDFIKSQVVEIEGSRILIQMMSDKDVYLCARLVVTNQLSEPLLCQGDDGHVHSIDEACVVDSDNGICFSLDGEQWSPSISLTKPCKQRFVLENKLIQCMIVATSYRTLHAIVSRDASPPVLWKNTTRRRISFQFHHEGIKMDMEGESTLEYDPVLYEPDSMFQTADSNYTFCLLDQDGTAWSNVLELRLGVQQVNLSTNLSMYVVASYEHHTMVVELTMSAPCTTLEPVQSYRFTIEKASVGLFDETSAHVSDEKIFIRELCHVDLHQLSCSIAPDKYQIEVKHFQLEHYFQNCDFPVLLCFYDSEVDNHISFSSTAAKSHLSITPLLAELEDVVVYALLDRLSPIIQALQTLSNDSSSSKEPLFIPQLVIDPLTIYLTARTPYLGVYRTPVTFSQVLLRQLSMPLDDLLSELAANYVADLVMRSPVLFGSLDMLGNPSGFVRSIGTGVHELFTTGQVTSLFRHVSQGTLSSIAGLSSSIARNMNPPRSRSGSAVGFETDRQARSRRPEYVSEGLTHGLQQFTSSVYNAATGLVYEPISQLEQEASVKSFAKGVGKGLIQALSRPAGGVAGFFEHVSEGLLYGTGMDQLHQPAQDVQWLRCTLNRELWFQSKAQVGEPRKVFDGIWEADVVPCIDAATAAKLLSRTQPMPSDMYVIVTIILSKDCLFLLDADYNILERCLLERLSTVESHGVNQITLGFPPTTLILYLASKSRDLLVKMVA